MTHHHSTLTKVICLLVVGLLQGQNWFGSATVEVVDGLINATILCLALVE